MKSKRKIYVIISVFIVAILLIVTYFLFSATFFDPQNSDDTNMNGGQTDTSDVYDVIEYDQPFKQEFNEDEYNEIIDQLIGHGYSNFRTTSGEDPYGRPYVSTGYATGNARIEDESLKTERVVKFIEFSGEGPKLNGLELIDDNDSTEKYYADSDVYWLSTGRIEVIEIPVEFENEDNEWILELFHVPHSYY